jgi:hypothetical protein
MNRSAVLYGHTREVASSTELYVVARAITYHVRPGREKDAVAPGEEDWREKLILAMPIEEANSKVRTGHR